VIDIAKLFCDYQILRRTQDDQTADSCLLKNVKLTMIERSDTTMGPVNDLLESTISSIPGLFYLLLLLKLLLIFSSPTSDRGFPDVLALP